MVHRGPSGVSSMRTPAACRLSLIASAASQSLRSLAACRWSHDWNQLLWMATLLLEQERKRRGRWILEPHEDSHSEYAVTGVVEGEVVRGLVDRTFVDAGVRWVIDFKTSEHQGGKLEEFLDEQQRRYRDQMERYARILEPLGNPVRLGLYFPLLDQWREWAPERASIPPQQARLFSF